MMRSPQTILFLFVLVVLVVSPIVFDFQLAKRKQRSRFTSPFKFENEDVNLDHQNRKWKNGSNEISYFGELGPLVTMNIPGCDTDNSFDYSVLESIGITFKKLVLEVKLAENWIMQPSFFQFFKTLEKSSKT